MHGKQTTTTVLPDFAHGHRGLAVRGTTSMTIAGADGPAACYASTNGDATVQK